eukprot:sb/3474426/
MFTGVSEELPTALRWTRPSLLAIISSTILYIFICLTKFIVLRDRGVFLTLFQTPISPVVEEIETSHFKWILGVLFFIAPVVPMMWRLIPKLAVLIVGVFLSGLWFLPLACDVELAGAIVCGKLTTFKVWRFGRFLNG